jgi:hypothetical protein
MNAIFENQFSLDDVKGLAKKFDFVQKNAETYINEYFQSVIRDVDLRREQLKAKIDDYSDVLIESLKKKQLDCVTVSKETNETTEKIEKSKAELNEFIKEIETLLDYKEFDVIENKFSEFKKEFETSLAKYKNILTENQLSFNFHEMPIQDVFGVLGVRPEKVNYLLLYFIFQYFNLKIV